MKRIAINCTAAVNIDLADLTPLQGNLKELSEINFKKLSDSILTHGVTFPFFVWRHDGKNWILDGTQRDRVLKKMADDGYDIPPLPCALIEAKDRREAAQKILLISSSYGRMTDEGLYEFLSENDIDFPELEPLLALDDIDLGDFKLATSTTRPLIRPVSTTRATSTARRRSHAQSAGRSSRHEAQARLLLARRCEARCPPLALLAIDADAADRALRRLGGRSLHRRCDLLARLIQPSRQSLRSEHRSGLRADPNRADKARHASV